MKIIFKTNGKFILNTYESAFLGAYIIRYANMVKDNEFLIDENKRTLLIEGSQKLKIISHLIEESLNVGINEFYLQPTIRQIQKHPNRFERFIYRGTKYTVNNTFIGPSRLIWILNNIYVSILKELSNNGSVSFEF